MRRVVKQSLAVIMTAIMVFQGVPFADNINTAINEVREVSPFDLPDWMGAGGPIEVRAAPHESGPMNLIPDYGFNCK